jgi:hypothetical protein
MITAIINQADCLYIITLSLSFHNPKEIKMELFNKELKDTDIQVRFSFPSRSLQYLDFAGEFFVDLKVKDSSGKLRVIRCRKRDGDYNKPWLSKGWLQFVADYGLIVGDMVVLLREDDHRLGSQFRIEAKRKIILFGEEAWGDVPRAN